MQRNSTRPTGEEKKRPRREIPQRLSGRLASKSRYGLYSDRLPCALSCARRCCGDGEVIVFLRGLSFQVAGIELSEATAAKARE